MQQFSSTVSAQLVAALMAPAELLLALLEYSHPLEDLKKIDLEGFNWSTRFDTGQTLLVRCIRNALVLPEEKKGERLKIIDWLIGSGASIEQACTGGQSIYCWSSKPEIKEIKVQCKGLSAIAYVRVLRGLMRENLEHWKAQDDFLAQVLSLFAASSPSASRHRVPIDEGIAELWEKSLAAKESHDLTIETADGLVTAHAHMLKAASAVVTAMLDSPMKEGKAQRIEVKDASSKAVSLFLEMLVGQFLITHVCFHHHSTHSLTGPSSCLRPWLCPGSCTPLQCQMSLTTRQLCMLWMWLIAGKRRWWW